MRVVFLDLDGVMIVHSQPKGTWLDPVKVEFLNQITMATGAKIVITSNARASIALDDFQHMAKREHVQADVIDVTPWLWAPNQEYQRPRRDEIEAWIDAHPDVTEFVVLDDDDRAYIPGHTIRTIHAFGLERQHVKMAVAMLVPARTRA